MNTSIIRSIAVLAALAASPAAFAYGGGDAVAGAVIGGGAGALIGNAVGGRDGAIVGGVIGAVAGTAIATRPVGYYGQPQYGAPVYPAPPRVY